MKNTKLVISFFIIALIIIGAFLIFSPKQKETKVVKIGYLPITASLPLFIAQERGYFIENELNVELVKFATSNQLVDALVRRDIDVEAGTSSSVTITALQNNPNLIKVFMVNSFNPDSPISSLIVKKDSTINFLEDLKGKKIGSFPGSTMKTYVKIYFEKNNAFDENTQIIELAPNLQLQAISSGSIDALITLEPLPTIGEIKGITQTLVSAPIETDVLNPWIAGTFSFNSNFASDELSKKIINSLKSAIDYMRENPEDARNYLIKYTPVTEESIVKKVPLPNTLKKVEINLSNFQEMADLLFEEGILMKRVDVKNIVID